MLIPALRNGATLPDIKHESADPNRMKTSRICCSLLLAAALTAGSAQAADPPPPAAPSAADIQALMALLNKIVAQSAAATAAESAASDEPAPPPAAPVAPTAPASAAKPPLSTALKTGSLSAGGLAPSSGLGGHGAGTVARLTEEAWRLLFPAKQPGN